MGKKAKSSNIGRILTTGSGNTYTLQSATTDNGTRIYKYKWVECPDKDYVFESRKELDSLDMAEEILQYKLSHRIYR